jgi:hypothetical protein
MGREDDLPCIVATQRWTKSPQMMGPTPAVFLSASGPVVCHSMSPILEDHYADCLRVAQFAPAGPIVLQGGPVTKKADPLSTRGNESTSIRVMVEIRRRCCVFVVCLCLVWMLLGVVVVYIHRRHWW